MIGLNRILVPTDFSDSSQAALRYGIALARKFDSRLHLLHVPEHPGEAADRDAHGRADCPRRDPPRARRPCVHRDS